MYKEFKAMDYRIQRNNQLNEVFISQDPEMTQNGVPHEYKIARYDNKLNPIFETDIVFQKGPRNEATSTPGIIESDLLEVVRNRLQAHQASHYATRENALALTTVEEALMWMQKRADDRAERGVLGTTQK